MRCEWPHQNGPWRWPVHKHCNAWFPFGLTWWHHELCPAVHVVSLVVTVTCPPGIGSYLRPPIARLNPAAHFSTIRTWNGVIPTGAKVWYIAPLCTVLALNPSFWDLMTSHWQILFVLSKTQNFPNVMLCYLKTGWVKSFKLAMWSLNKLNFNQR